MILALATSLICAPLPDVVATLADQYGEHEVSRGKESRGVIVQVYASAAGTFSVVIVRPDFTACLLASGDGYMQLPMGDLN